LPRTYVEKVSRDLYLLRVDDDEIKFFEGLWSIPEGITYNAYVLATEEGAVVFDTWRNRYSNLFVECLRKVVDPKDVRYVVVHHMEPDHSGSLPKLLGIVGVDRVEILGHPMAGSMIRSFYGIDARFRPVKDLEALRIGRYTIRFIHTPWLHWPETIMSFVEELGALLSCDAFGGYSIPSTLFDDDLDDIEEYLEFVRKYIVTVIGFYRPFIAKNIDKIRSLNLDVKIVAPSHGVVWRRDPSRIVDYYYRASRGEIVDPKKITVIYSSMYGFLEEAVSKIVDALRSKGFRVAIHRFVESEHASLGNALSDAFDSSLLILGISTYEGGIFPLMKMVLDALGKKVTVPKRVVVLASYGWGSPRNVLEKMVRDAGHEVVEVIDFRGRASSEVIERVLSLVERYVA